MKGIILAGGLGTRLRPLTEITNKHLLPVGTEPMIWHPVRQLVHANINEIMVITSTHHMGAIVNSLGSGKRFNCDFTYKVQEEPNGIAGALALAKQYCLGQRLVVLLADNIFQYTILPYVNAFRKQDGGARVLLKAVGDPERFGIAALDEKTIVNISEKPQSPKSNFAVVGCYMYDSHVFDAVNAIQNSTRGEYEITSVNNKYIEDGKLEYSFVRGGWTDAGTIESLNEANQLMLKSRNQILD